MKVEKRYFDFINYFQMILNVIDFKIDEYKYWLFMIYVFYSEYFMFR